MRDASPPSLPSLSSPPAPWRGLWIPLVTPFADGAVDHAALARLVRSLADTGIAGFVVCGTTGEAAALSAEEQLACLATVAREAPGLPLMMGVSGHHLGETRERVHTLAAQRAEVPALSALLVAAPCYIRPSQDGIRHWFETLADAGELPLVVYDIPYRTGATIARETLLALAAHPRIVALKDCGGDAAKTLALIADGRLAVLAGDDLQIFATVAQGGAGAIAASAHRHTRRFVELLQALGRGDLPTARDRWRGLVPWIEAAFAEPNPAGVKAALALDGWMTPALRPPMTAASTDLRQRLIDL